MEETSTVITCQSCRRQLRVPIDQGKLTLTCPSCRASWDWTPPTKLSDVRILPFRCAQTGQRFFVTFGQPQLPLRKYRILSVFGQAPSADGPTKPQDLPRQPPQALRNVEAFDAADFDFAGWYCPCCGHGKAAQAAIPFVRCSTCHEYVCGGRIIQIPDGPATFACHDGCGGSGRIEGQIASFDGVNIEPTSSQLRAPSDRAGLTLPEGARQVGIGHLLEPD